jgi:hypothetical protein
MPNNGRVSSLIAFTPEVNAFDLSVLYRPTGYEDLRVLGERGLQIREKLQVLLEAMVGLEVRFIR